RAGSGSRSAGPSHKGKMSDSGSARRPGAVDEDDVPEAEHVAALREGGEERGPVVQPHLLFSWDPMDVEPVRMFRREEREALDAARIVHAEAREIESSSDALAPGSSRRPASPRRPVKGIGDEVDADFREPHAPSIVEDEVTIAVVFIGLLTAAISLGEGE